MGSRGRRTAGGRNRRRRPPPSPRRPWWTWAASSPRVELGSPQEMEQGHRVATARERNHHGRPTRSGKVRSKWSTNSAVSISYMLPATSGGRGTIAIVNIARIVGRAACLPLQILLLATPDSDPSDFVWSCVAASRSLKGRLEARPHNNTPSHLVLIVGQASCLPFRVFEVPWLATEDINRSMFPGMR